MSEITEVSGEKIEALRQKFPGQRIYLVAEMMVDFDGTITKSFRLSLPLELQEVKAETSFDDVLSVAIELKKP